MNLGKRDAGSLSPWSVFNPNFEVMPGTLTADQLDRQFRHQYGPGEGPDREELEADAELREQEER